MADRRRRWRPGPDTAIALAALLFAGGGVSWAVTQNSSPSVITSCVDQNNFMHLSTDGTCPVGSGQTTVQWNQQGPAGPTGVQGAPGLVGSQGPPGRNAAQPVVATVHQTFHYKFAVVLSFSATGTYFVDGSVTEQVNTAGWSTVYRKYGAPGITCFLIAGPPTTTFDQETQTFYYYGGTIDRYYPLTVNGPAGAAATIKVTSLPYTAKFQCEGTTTKGPKITRVVNAGAAAASSV
jgi:hypothetical protein